MSAVLINTSYTTSQGLGRRAFDFFYLWGTSTNTNLACDRFQLLRTPYIFRFIFFNNALTYFSDSAHSRVTSTCGGALAGAPFFSLPAGSSLPRFECLHPHTELMSGNVSPRGPKRTRQTTPNSPKRFKCCRALLQGIGATSRWANGATVFQIRQGLHKIQNVPRHLRFRGCDLHDRLLQQEKGSKRQSTEEKRSHNGRQNNTETTANPYPLFINNEIDCNDDARHRFCTVVPLRQNPVHSMERHCVLPGIPPGHSPAPSLLYDIYKSLF